MALYQYGGSSKPAPRTGKSEFEILKASHRFLRDEDDKNLSWDDQLASKYYASLYREFAVCDLKHYKSGNFALRWRTESEVLSGAGETTCGNTRCKHHSIPDHLIRTTPPLTTLELPFAYVEHEENKSALVKVVLCPRCFDKLMWKRRKEKEIALERAEEQSTKQSGERPHSSEDAPGIPLSGPSGVKIEEVEIEMGASRRSERRPKDGKDGKSETQDRQRRRRHARSASPRSDRRTTEPAGRDDYARGPT